MAKFPERKLPVGQVLAALNDQNRYDPQDRYATTKVISLLWTKALASKVPSSQVIINAPTPGFCKTGLMSNTSGIMGFIVKLSMLLIGRSAEDGARCLVHSALVTGDGTHGKYLSEMTVKPESELVRSQEGQQLETKMWDEIVEAFARKNIQVKQYLDTA